MALTLTNAELIQWAVAFGAIALFIISGALVVWWFGLESKDEE